MAALKLYYHPLASYCWKALIALYEADIAFEGEIVIFGDRAKHERFYQLWPPGQFPLIEDKTSGAAMPESTAIIEYLAVHHPSARGLVPADPAAALEARFMDRFFDHHIHQHMQAIVADVLKPEARRDAETVAKARADLQTAYAYADARLAGRAWGTGQDFTLADCAAAPALFYATIIEPFAPAHATLAAYLERLLARPSFARVLAEAKPYFQYFPFKSQMPGRFL